MIVLVSKPANGFSVAFVQCLLSLLILAAFLAVEFSISLTTYNDSRLGVLDNLKRIQLIKQITKNPENLGRMAGDDIAMILRDPSLQRRENTVVAWHYHGESCALDIYFSNTNMRPDYVEYRPLSLNNKVHEHYQKTDQASLNDYCLKDVLDAQGVNTPENVARQPVPSWNNPYRS